MKVGQRVIKILWYFFRPHKVHCAGVLILMVISGLLETLNVGALYPVINYGLNLDSKNRLLEQFERMAALFPSKSPFFVACVVLIGISIFSVAIKLVYTYFSNALQIRTVGSIQKSLFEKFAALDYGFFVKHQQGQLIYAGTTAPERTGVAVFYSIMLAYNLINASLLFSLLIFLSWQATVVIILMGVFYGLVIERIMKKNISKCAKINVEENQRKNVILNEFITGIKIIKVFLAAGDWRVRYVHAVDRGLSHQFRMLVVRAFPETFIKFLFYVLIAVTGMVFSQKPGAEVVALLPMLGTFAVVVNRFLPSIHVLGSSIMQIAECMPAVTIVHNLCAVEPVVLLDGKREMEGFCHKISFEDVWFKYAGADEFLLRGLSFFIERKKMTAIVGLSGAGKTTIINLLLKLYRVDRGAIYVDGTDIGDFTNKSYLSKIGYVSQETFIFNSSFKENIRFGLQDCTEEMIMEAAKLANAHDFIVETSQGYDTIVGDSGVKISGGQRQRIAIARAMLRKPEIIVFDEATSSLDNISEKKIQSAINNISKHTTVLVIAHRLSTVQSADKIIILEKGELREQGTHNELLQNKKLYYDLHMSKDVVGSEMAGEGIG